MSKVGDNNTLGLINYKNFKDEKIIIQAGRIATYLVILFLVVLTELFQKNFYNWQLFKTFYLVTILGLSLNGLVILKPNYFFSRNKLLFITFIVDLLAFTFLLLSNNLNQSIFVMIYLVMTMLSGLVFRLRGALQIAFISSICFSTAVLLGPDLKSLSYFFLLITNNIAFFAVAFFSGLLSESLNLFSQKIAQQNLSIQSMEEMNELIIETIPNGLLTVNQTGEIIQANPSALNLFKNEDLLGQNIKSLLPELTEIDRRIENLEIKKSIGNDNYLFKVNVIPYKIESLFLVLLDDITLVKKLEISIRQNEKMAAIGQLSAGIAHEIRNPLASISGSIELLAQPTSSEEKTKLSQIILREINRLNNLISDFLDFAKPTKIPIDSVNLTQLLGEVIDNCKSMKSNVAEFDIDIEKDLSINGDRDKLKQAFLNIAINAIQAMDKTENAVLSVSAKAENRLVIIKIKDGGSGMSEETKARLFEPFYTTKSKGTGLGLALTHKILESHSAAVVVESEISKGTEFIIKFIRK